MKKILNFDNKGLTVIELIIGLALTFVVFVAVAVFLIGNINFSNTAQDEIYVQEQVRNAMKVITDLAMDKESCVLDNSSHITLKKGTNEEAEQIVFEHDVNSRSLKYIDSAGTSKVIASDIQEFQVESFDNKIFNVTIKSIKNGGTKKEVSFELANQIFLRNYKEPEVPSG
jgi:hypothetical protein